MPAADWPTAASELSSLLHLAAPPIAITFSDHAPAGVPAFDEPMSEAQPDGRQGRVPAGCVFWMRATDETFTTVPQDHGNCSVGSMTHGMLSLEEAAGRSDVATLIEADWVTPEVAAQIPAVAERPGHVTYGPLAETPVEPDVVFLRVNGRQLMTISDALPGLRIEGKPQCHIIPIAKEQGEVAASVGCALSRVRTGMQPHEMTCAIPAAKLGEVLDRLRSTVGADTAVAKYAADDARRFG